jgi:hypothetical protein
MAGTLKIELSGATKEELKRQLEDVIRELDKINFRPGNRFTLGNPQAWKVVGSPQAWKVVGGPQAWKVVGRPQAWDPGKVVEYPQAVGNLRTWKMTYET